jgi:hypothetical protein
MEPYIKRQLPVVSLRLHEGKALPMGNRNTPTIKKVAMKASGVYVQPRKPFATKQQRETILRRLPSTVNRHDHAPSQLGLVRDH